MPITLLAVLKFYLYLHKWFNEGLKWQEFADRTLIGMILVYLINKRLIQPIGFLFKNLDQELKKIESEWNGTINDDILFGNIFLIN